MDYLKDGIAKYMSVPHPSVEEEKIIRSIIGEKEAYLHEATAFYLGMEYGKKLRVKLNNEIDDIIAKYIE